MKAMIYLQNTELKYEAKQEKKDYRTLLYDTNLVFYLLDFWSFLKKKVVG